ARRLSPDMLPAPGAARGLVAVAALERLPRLAQPGDLVMARTNAPLPSLALELVAAGLPVRILGHDLVGQAKELSRVLFPDTLPATPEVLVASSAESERLRLEDELLTSDDLPSELERSRNAHAALLLALRSLSRTPMAQRPAQLE